MRNRVFLVSALVGLFLALGAAPALGESGAGSKSKVDSFSMFGVTFCLPDAEPAEGCQVRLGEPAEQEARTLTEPVPERSEPAGPVLRLFGYRICLGNAPAEDCDLRVPPLLPDPDGRDRHAKL